METSTPETNSLQEVKPETDMNSDDLSPEEQLFYSSIKPTLNAMLEDPPPETVNKIINYSKSV